MRERGEWIVGDPLPGQDLQAAREAAPGSPAGFVSYGLTARFEPTSGEGAAPEAAWAGEVRGPRIQLARRDEGTSRVLETRMAGYVSGRLMWLWEKRAGDTATGGHVAEESVMIPYLSLELDRA